MRELGPGDEGALRALVRRVYGDTYSYRRLYEAGGIAGLIESGQVSLWGDFAASGELASHTGFFYKDPRGDYVESGMSLRNPAVRPVTTDTEVWRRFFEWLGTRFAYIHQNTTTYHPLAQRYAERYMRACPTGLVVDYAVGERLVGLACSEAPMHALTMTTVIAGHRRPDVRVPRGPWAEWLATIALGLGLAPVVVDPKSFPLAVGPIEHNTALDLRRRSVARAGELLAPAQHRVELIHVPLDERLGAFAELVSAGYVPVGLRPHATRPHELVMQHLADRPALAMRLAPSGAALVTGWNEACARAT
jgi:hypothetical protein